VPPDYGYSDANFTIVFAGTGLYPPQNETMSIQITGVTTSSTSSTTTSTTSTTSILGCGDCVSCTNCLSNNCEWCDELFGFGSCKDVCIEGWWGDGNCIGDCYDINCDGAETSTSTSTTSTSTTTSVSTSVSTSSTTSSTTSTSLTTSTSTTSTSTTTSSTTTVLYMEIKIESPENTTYEELPIDLNVTTNETADWCGWNLNGTENETMNGSDMIWFNSITCPVGTHHLLVYCNDTNGNFSSNESVWFSYHTTTTSTVETTTTYSGGSGGGSGGLTTTIEPEISGEGVAIEDIEIDAGGTLSIKMENFDLLDEISLNPDENISGGRITIRNIEHDGLGEVPGLHGSEWNVYQYLSIDTENIGSTTGVTVYFLVDEEWMEENFISYMSLWKYDDGWRPIATETMERISGLAHYKSNFEGFSFFAVAGKIEEPTTSIPDGTVVSSTGSVCGDGLCSPDESSENCTADCEFNNSGGGGLNLFLILMLIIIIAIGAAVVFIFFNFEEVEIYQLLSNTEKYQNKRVVVNAEIIFSKAIENGDTVYRIRDSSGEINAISKHGEYEGIGNIKGVLKKDSMGLHIKF